MKREGIIIGGGASGLMAAISAAESGAAVTILEHMPRAGKKILATGNGKCNMTNRELSAACYRCPDPGFPMEVIRKFPVEDTLLAFRSMGVLAMDRNGYVYPASGQAQTVLEALLEKAGSLGVRILCGCEVHSIAKKGGRFQAQTSQGAFEGDFLVLAAGSMAAKATGSDGSGYGLAKSFGHKVNRPLPALVQLRCRMEGLKAAAGVRCEARVSLYAEEGKKTGTGCRLLASDRGELQITDYGISGIPVFQVSRFASEALAQGQKVSAVLDFLPACSFQQAVDLLTEQRACLKDWKASFFINGIFNRKLAGVLLKAAGIPFEEKIASISARQVKKLAALIKEYPLPVSGTNPYEQAQTCMGGVSVREVNPSTMESKLVPGLYFAGEILDVDGICGGYNLQWAWSSGHLAGESAAKGCL